MKRNIIFFKPEHKFTSTLSLNQDEIGHLRSLRLLKRKILLDIRDGKGHSCIYEKEPNSNEITKTKEEDFRQQEQKIQIATAIPKGNLLNLWLKKGTEIGVSHFYFLIFQNSERKDFNLQKCEKMVQEAAAQSRRYYLPKIEKPILFHNFIKPDKDYVLLHPYAKCPIHKHQFQATTISLIGPEGGLNQEEIDFAIKKNIPFVHLGSNILRIETAGLFIASLCKSNHLSNQSLGIETGDKI